MNPTSLVPIVIDQSILMRFVIALVLGAFIGAEREMIQQRLNIQEFGGIRSFMFIAMMGFLSSYLSKDLTVWIILVTFIILSVLVAIGYIHKSFHEDKSGITSELSALITFIIGILSFTDYSLAIIMGIVTALILSIKTPLHTFITKVKDEEFFATVEFALLTFVILPLLPNRTIDPWNIINPYEIWLLIVFMLGISFVGYILNRAVGSGKGTLLTGMIGGIVSSTAVTQSMSVKSKTEGKIRETLVAATLAATGIMFLRVFVVVFTLNNKLIPFLIFPLAGMFLITLAEIFIYIMGLKGISKIKGDPQEDIMKESPFKLMPAVKFGLFFVAILFISEFAKTYLGTQGIYLAAMITGLADIDAFMLSMIKMSIADPSFIVTATKAITIAIMSNMAVKAVIPFFFGERQFALKVLRNLGLIAVAGVIITLLL